MDVLLELHEKARRLGKRIVLPESQDPRVVQAAARLQSEGLCHPVLVEGAGMAGVPGAVELVRPSRDARLERFAAELYERRKHRGMTVEDARERVKDPLVFAGMLLHAGDCDGAVAGSEASTPSVIRAGLWTVGTARGIDTVSSSFLMVLDDAAYTYGDCGVVPDPTPEQLVDIALASADSHRRLVGQAPRVALLSFSTKGSADAPAPSRRCSTAAELLLKERAPSLISDGELQVDAAIVPRGRREARLRVRRWLGGANVLDLPRPRRRQHRLQAHRATGRGQGPRPPGAGPRAALPRPLPRVHGGRHRRRGVHRFRAGTLTQRAVPMLEMRPACELCQERLDPAAEAFICSFECTFCPRCAARRDGRCPNCGGELVRRPRRDAAD